MVQNDPKAKTPAKAEDVDAIPMSKTKPTTFLFVGGAVALVIGVIAFSTLGGEKKKKASDLPAAGAATEDDGMTLEERKRHLEITRKSLEKYEAEKAIEDQKKKAAEEEAKRKEEEEKAKVAAAAGPAPAGGGEPKKPVNKAAAKKQIDALDNLGSDIAGKLNK